MRSGKLRFRVGVYSPPTSSTTHAGTVEDWDNGAVLVGTVSCDIENLSSREQSTAALRQSTETHRVSCRWNSITAQITNAYRLKYGTRWFGITSITDDFRRKERTISVEEVMA